MATDSRHLIMMQNGLASAVIDSLTSRFGEDNIIPASIGKFPAGALYNEFYPFDRKDFEANLAKIRGSIVTIVQSSGEPCDQNIRYSKLAAEVAKRAGAKLVQGVFPYQEYMRQDKDELEIGRFSSMANPMIAKEYAMAGFDHVTLVTPHSEAGIKQYRDIFGDNLSLIPATDIYLAHIRRTYPSIDNLVIGAPDGMDKQNDQGQKRAIEIAKAIFGDDYKNHMFGIAKKRTGPGKSEIVGFEGNVEGKIAIIIDDMIDTGGTMVLAAEELKKRGAIEVSASAVHGLFSEGLKRLLVPRDNEDRPFVDNILVSNTLHVSQKINESAFEIPNVRQRVDVIDISEHLIRSIEQNLDRKNQIMTEARNVPRNLVAAITGGIQR